MADLTAGRHIETSAQVMVAGPVKLVVVLFLTQWFGLPSDGWRISTRSAPR
jgi:hypothetical protein